MDKIKLSELKQAWAELKTGNWSLPLVDHQRKLAEATDTLIEIAQAALAWQRAKFASPLGYSSIAGEREALESALSKVEP